MSENEIAQQPSLYEAIKAAGIETDHHESDLYFPATDESMEILRRYPMSHKNSVPFTCNTTGKRWIDVPFQYDPFWEKAQRRSNKVGERA